MRRFVTSLALLLPFLGCPETAPPPPPELVVPLAGTAPVRRLTEEELNRTLRDLFARDGVAIELPFVALNDGEAGSGTQFDGDVSRQTPSDLVVEQLRAGAIAVSAAAVARKDVLLPRQPASAEVAELTAVGEELVAELLPRAFRRPPDPEEVETYAAFFRGQLAAHNFDVALQLVLQAILQAPSFVYRVEIGGGPVADPQNAVALLPYEVAARLSYLLWGTMPDAALFDAAARGELATPEQIEAQARRMLEDPRARDSVLSFHRQWLDLDAVLASNKDAATFPEWNDGLRRALRDEADAMIELAIFGDDDGAGADQRLAHLLTTTATGRVSPDVASLYGIPPPPSVDDLVELPGEQRAGVLTSGAFLASRAHPVFGSPVLRGIFVLDRFLCETPPPPEAGIDTTPPDAADQQGEARTNRDRYAEHTTNNVCQSCHAGIDGIGFGLESYDAIGRFRTEDNGLPVDASGSFEATGLGGTFNGGVEMARLLANSELVHDCVARKWLTWSRGRSEEIADAAYDGLVVETFREKDGDIKELLVAIATSPAFRTRAAPAAAGGAQ